MYVNNFCLNKIKIELSGYFKKFPGFNFAANRIKQSKLKLQQGQKNQNFKISRCTLQMFFFTSKLTSFIKSQPNCLNMYFFAFKKNISKKLSPFEKIFFKII